MNLKIKVLFVLFCGAIMSSAQDWKTYPYAPAGSEIAFPVDEGRHTDPIEWWYTSGHLQGTTSGKEYSYMLTYFHFPQSGFDGFRILNITDEETGELFEDTKPLNYTKLSTTSLDIEAAVFLGGTETWSNKVDASNMPIPFEYVLSANGSSGGLDLEYVSTKRPLIVGDDGLFDQGAEQFTYYYSLTNNEVSGTLSINGVQEEVTGKAWLDRQYGTFNPLIAEKYEWFSLQLSNGMDINLWNIFTEDRKIPESLEYRILSAYVDENTQYTTNDFDIERLAYHCTPDGERCYSQKWRLSSATNNIDLVVTARHNDSEVKLPFRFYEGSIDIAGTINGIEVTGVGFAELLQSYEHPEVSLLEPSNNTYDTAMPITWMLNNPDDGRPLLYDIEYSIDNQQSFTMIEEGISDSSYLWETPSVANGDLIWFRISSYSVDKTLISMTVSSQVATVVLAEEEEEPMPEETVVVLYPNPAESLVNLSALDLSQKTTYAIFDEVGRLVLSADFENTSGESTIDVSALTSGIYYLKVVGQEETKAYKLLKR